MDNIPELGPFELQKLLAENSAGQLVDVREDWEFKQGYIPGSMHIPMQQIPDRLGDIKASGPAVIICHSGQRSAAVTAYLIARGYQNVVNLTGGVEKWVAHQLPFVTE